MFVKFAICFCWFLSIYSNMSTLIVPLLALQCSCDASLLSLMFSNIFSQPKIQHQNNQKSYKNVSFDKTALPAQLRSILTPSEILDPASTQCPPGYQPHPELLTSPLYLPHPPPPLPKKKINLSVYFYYSTQKHDDSIVNKLSRF